MRIGIDLRPLQTSHKFRGIGRYTYYLLKNIAAIDDQNEYLLFLDERREVPNLDFLKSSFRRSLAAIPAFDAGAGLERVWDQQVTVPSSIAKHNIDVFHFTEFTIPVWHPFTSIVTIHDLIQMRLRLKLKEYSGISFALRSVALRKNAHIVVNSQATRNDAIELLGIPAGNISVTLLGVDESFRPYKKMADVDGVRKKYKLPEQFIFYAGSLERRKNVTGLVSAFGAISARHPDLYLVILADTSGPYAEIASEVKALPVGGRVLFLDTIASFEPQDLAGIYNAAVFYATASMYEGFGMPLVEAMACGLPVVCSNNSSHPEIVGDGGIIVDDGKTEAMAEAFERLLGDETLRLRLKEKALGRAAVFSWEKTARQTIEVYKKVNEGVLPCA